MKQDTVSCTTKINRPFKARLAGPLWHLHPMSGHPGDLEQRLLLPLRCRYTTLFHEKKRCSKGNHPSETEHDKLYCSRTFFLTEMQLYVLEVKSCQHAWQDTKSYSFFQALLVLKNFHDCVSLRNLYLPPCHAFPTRWSFSSPGAEILRIKSAALLASAAWGVFWSGPKVW